LPFPRRDPLVLRSDDQLGRDRSVQRGRRLRARLRVGRSVAEIGAEKRADAAVRMLLTEMDMRLLDGRREILIRQAPCDQPALIVDVGRERAMSGRRDAWHLADA